MLIASRRVVDSRLRAGGAGQEKLRIGRNQGSAARKLGDRLRRASAWPCSRKGWVGGAGVTSLWAMASRTGALQIGDSRGGVGPSWVGAVVELRAEGRAETASRELGIRCSGRGSMVERAVMRRSFG